MRAAKYIAKLNSQQVETRIWVHQTFPYIEQNNFRV